MARLQQLATRVSQSAPPALGMARFTIAGLASLVLWAVVLLGLAGLMDWIFPLRP